MADLQRAMAAGRLSSRRPTEAYFRRIEPQSPTRWIANAAGRAPRTRVRGRQVRQPPEFLKTLSAYHLTKGETGGIVG
jgi:hypothetical protein